MTTTQVASCQNHPQREAIGLCVQCRIRVCSECSTKVDGINYCVTCLAGLAEEGGRHVGARREAGRAKSHLWLAVELVILTAGVWLLLETLLPG